MLITHNLQTGFPAGLLPAKSVDLRQIDILEAVATPDNLTPQQLCGDN